MSDDNPPSGEFQLKFDRAMERRERALRETAERQVGAFIEVISDRFSVPQEEIPELLESTRWLLKQRRMFSGWKAGLLGTALGSLVIAAWEGAKLLWHKAVHE